MIRGQHNSMLADLATLFNEGCATGLSEGQLLDRFLSNGDEAAFEAILRRHGPMVLGVCRRRLSDPGDVDDAFQATFLILVERGRTLRDRDILGTWLHRVAHRVATRARSDAYRRREFEGRGVLSRRHEREASPEAAAERADLRAILDEELARLSEKYRTPLILCELEGWTHEQAAARICCPVGTVKSRLSRAREQLRSRLERRGVSAMAPAVFSFESIPKVLSEGTLRAAARLAAGKGVPATAVAALMETASRSSLMTLSKLFATVLSTAVIISAAAGGQEPPSKPAVSAAPERQKPQAALVDSKPAAAPAFDPAVPAKEVPIVGKCVDWVDKTPMPGATVRLFAVRGYTEPIVEVAKTKTDGEGRFSFAAIDLPRPRHEDPVDPLTYLLFAEVKGRPGGFGAFGYGADREIVIHIFRDEAKVTGTVRDTKGRPVAGAVVSQPWTANGLLPIGIVTDVTGADGRFAIDGLSLKDKSLLNNRLVVAHPDYPRTWFDGTDPSRPVDVVLLDGCRASGFVTYAVSGKPAAGAVVTAEALGTYERISMTTNVEGRYSMTLNEDRYNFSAMTKDRVSVALTEQECLAGQTKELPPLTMIEGGFIAGRVLDTATRKPITIGNSGEPIALDLIGPSHPLGKAISSRRTAIVDSTGHYTLRAAPGENFPFFINISGDRMGWDTMQQPAVVVKAGETTEYDMLVTRKPTSAEEMKAAREVIAALPADHAQRTARILEEFRKLSRSVDQTALWASLMRDLVGMGKDAVPLICAELDRTTEDRTLRRLVFALRGIGDKSAVPALIRAIPRTLVPSSSDYGLAVTKDRVPGADELGTFMSEHGITPRQGRGRFFLFGRPVRELFASLEKLTGKNLDDAELFSISLSEDPRRQLLQRRMFTKNAKKWADWWNMHGRELVGEADFQAVDLKVDNEPIPPPAKAPFGPGARLLVRDGFMGMTLSPASQAGDDQTPYFYDLDTGAMPKWPAHIPKDEDRHESALLAKWAAENGVDLMCVTHEAANGKRTFVLRQFGLKAFEITPRDNRNLDKLLSSGKLPLGHRAGDLLVHFDEATKQDVPDANAVFVYITSDGNQGLIEITDRVTKTADLNGMTGDPPAGVGFNTGVRFDLKSIQP